MIFSNLSESAVFPDSESELSLFLFYDGGEGG